MLCKSCGEEMIAFEYCQNCNEAVHWRCSVCKKQNEKSVHTHNMQEYFPKSSVAGVAAVATTTFISGLSTLIQMTL